MIIETKFNINDKVWFLEEVYESEHCPHCNQVIIEVKAKKKVRVEGVIISFHYNIIGNKISSWYKVLRIPGFHGPTTGVAEDKLHLVVTKK